MNTNGLIDETMQPEHIVSAIHSRHAIGEFRILDLATSRERRVKWKQSKLIKITF